MPIASAVSFWARVGDDIIEGPPSVGGWVSVGLGALDGGPELLGECGKGGLGIGSVRRPG